MLYDIIILYYVIVLYIIVLLALYYYMINNKYINIPHQNNTISLFILYLHNTTPKYNNAI